MVNKQKILIVDDDEAIAELVSLYLAKECFDTMMVHDGEKALVAFDTYHPNLVLLGFDASRALTGIRSAARSVLRAIHRLSCFPAKGRFLIKYLVWSLEPMIIL